MEREAENMVTAAFARCRGALVQVGLFSLAINLLMLTTSIYMMQIFDRVLSSGSLETLIYLTVIATGAILFLSLLEVVRSRMLARISTWLEARLAPAALGRMIDQALARDGARAEALSDLGLIRGFLGGPGVLALFDAPWVPVYLAVVYLLHPALGHVALAGAVVLFGLALANDRLTRRPFQQATAVTRRAGRVADAALRNAEAVDAMGMTGNLVRRWVAVGGDALRLHGLAGDRAGLVLAASKFVRLFVQIAVLGVGAWLVVGHELTGGAMIAGSIIMGRALAPIEQGIGIWKHAVQARAAKAHLTAFFARPARRPETIRLPPPKARLAVENVVFGFTPGRPPVLHGVSVALEPGEALGIVGPTAAGKSTLARLLVGVDRPNAGSVRLDGADIFAWRRADLGRHLGYLPQDVELFSGSVAENISRLGPVDDARVVAAAKLANCHDMILAMEQGYGTELGAFGARLSGGQRQRVALARALYGEPKLVVLDEPDANLDGPGEAALNAAIAALKADGVAVVVIGHRSGTLAAVDRVLVLVGGTVARLGPPAEVLAAMSGRPAGPIAAVAGATAS